MAIRSRKKSSQPTKSPVVRQATKKPASKPKAAKPPPASPEPAPAPKTRGMVERAGGTQIRRITAYLPPELAKRLALFALEHDLDKNRVVVQAIEAHLDAQQAGR